MRFSQDARQRAAGTGANRRVTYTVYDDLGRVTRVGEAAANFSRLDPERSYPFENDASSWRSRMTYDGGGLVAGDPVAGNEVAGGGPNYAQGRLTKVEENTDADAAAEVVHEYAYDHLGNVRVKQVSIEGLAGTKTAAYNHDLAGRVTRLVYPDGAQARYAYDNAGRPTRVWDANGNTLAVYTHTAAGNIETHVAGEDVVTGTYAYNPREWVTEIDYAGKFRSELTYDLAGNVTRQKYSHGNAASKTADYAYDALYRITGFDLTGGTNRDYAYDRSGNLTSMMTGSSRLTYNYSGNSTPNRLDSTAVGSATTTYAYNQNGWMTARGANALTYDYRGLTTGYGSARYLMDPDRRRVKKTVGAAVTYYLRGPGGKVLAEYTGQTQSANYVYAGSRRIARIAGSSASYYLADHLGSTRSLVGEDGAVTAAYDYWPYGKILVSSGTGATHFRFTGHERDAESGLDYMLDRNYAYNIGRFLRPDPMQDEYPGISPYAYAANNPLKYVDPDGRALVFGAIVGAAIDVGIQVAVDGRSLDEIDLGSVAISAAAGATGVGLITKLSKVNKVARFGIEAATDAGFSALHQVNETGNVDLMNTVQDVAVGRSIGRVAGETAGRIAGSSSTVRHLTRDADRLKRIGHNAASQGRDSRAKSRYTRAEELYEKAQNYIARRAISASTAATQIGSRIFGWFTSDGEEERDKE
ncbi:MAG: RHS repeat-associated core domain-containing protein [Gemmatimonadetes bacterium]|nr:RHS repeat-associated core domain-containing protein [Gemmatimonadota bacterium]